MNPLLSRKFILAMSTLSASTWLCWSGRIADGVFSTVVIAVCGAYMAANVTQKIKEPPQ